MRAILEFDLPDEESNLQLAVDGYKWKSVIEEIDQILRNKAKYEEQETISIDEIRTIITDKMTYWGLKE